jgi:hypothetical protein
MRATLVAIIVLAACGGGGNAGKKPKKPTGDDVTKPEPPKPETEEDREKKRLAAAHEIVPEGSTCLPAALKPADGAPALEIGVVDSAPVMCAIDNDPELLLGPIACWTIDLQSGALTYKAPAPVPGRAFRVGLTGRCARGYCLPDDVAMPAPPVVHIAWSHGADKVAVAITGSEPEIHIFGAADKAHQGVIKPKDATHAARALPTDLASIVFVGDVVAAVGAAGDAGAPVFLFKTDGTAAGAVERLGGKTKGPVSVAKGSVSVFGDGQLALNEDAMTTLTTIEVATGKRAKLVRKPPKTACKAKDLTALIAGAETKASERCKSEFAVAYAPLIGATVVQGKKNHLVLLKGERYADLAVVDAKTLEENRSLDAKWCDAAGATAADGDAAPPAEGEAAPED